VGTKQLVGTIEKVETHENEHTTEEPPDPWETFHGRLGGLGDQVKATYRKVADENGPSESEIKDALGTLAGAWDQLAESVRSALQDPEIRHRLKEAASSFATALGATISELGSELRDSTSWSPTTPDREEEE
jgi:hypothetical protein